MRSPSGFFVLAVLAVLWVLFASCSKDKKDNNDNNDLDSGTDTDADTDSDTDTDTDTDTDSDTDSDIDTDTDTDTDSDTDADSSTDTDTDTDSDGGVPLPPGCEVIWPSNENTYGWAGWHSIDADHMVWRWIDHSTAPEESVLMVRTLSTGEEIEFQREPGNIHRFEGPSIWGNTIVFEDKIDMEVGSTREIFKIELGEVTPFRLTNNEQSDAEAISGQNFTVFHYAWDPPGPDTYDSGYKYVDLNDSSEHYIQQDLDSGLYKVAFDGIRWVAYQHALHLYKYDLQNTATPPQLMSATEMSFMWMAFNADTGELITGTYISGTTDNIGLDSWNMETNERTVIIDNPWDQGMPDASGYVIAYVDSEAAGENWFTDNRGQVKIIDRETKVVRTITPLVGRYYSIGIWDHWLAFNPTSYWGDVIVLCDLLEGGFVDTTGHVIPEGADLDAGVDGGN